MESEGYDIRNLREWYSINDVLQKIPSKIQKGLFLHELNVTCVDAVCEFLVFGSDVGIVFWYNRKNRKIQELRTEVYDSHFTYNTAGRKQKKKSFAISETETNNAIKKCKHLKCFNL